MADEQLISRKSVSRRALAPLFYLLVALAAGCGGGTTEPKSKANTAFAGLSEKKQKWVWDLEHFTFEIEKKFGKPFTKALSERDSKELLRFFVREFQTELPDPQARQANDQKWWTETGFTAAQLSETPKQKGGASELISYLISGLHRFESISGAKLRVLQINSDPPGKADQFWKLTILLTLNGQNSTGGPISIESTHEVRCQFKTDDDIAQGNILTDWTVVDEFIRSAPQAFFQEATEDFQLSSLPLRDNWKHKKQNGRPYTFLSAVDDFDRDGFLDIAISTWDGYQYVLRSAKGKMFVDATGKFAIPRVRSKPMETFATSIDFNNDGFPDLLLGESLYRNVEWRYFEDVTEKSNLKFDSLTMGAIVADYDCDGFLDLFVLNHHPWEQSQQIKGYVDDDDELGAENRLWRNKGDGSFEDVSTPARVTGKRRHTIAATWFFANDDRFPDLYVANDFGRNHLYINNGKGAFDDVSLEAGVSDFATSMGVATGDLSGNGKNEIYVANMFSKMGRRIVAHVGPEDYPDGLYAQIQGSCAGNRAYLLQDGKLVYQDISQGLGVNQVGWAYAPAICDFDGNGTLDLYVASGYLSYDRRKPDG